MMQMQGVFWQRKNRLILQNIHWAIQPGEQWVLLGPNGSGKSSLMNLLAGKTWPSAGSIQWNFGSAHEKDRLDAQGNAPTLLEIQNQIALFQPLEQEHCLQPGLKVWEIICTGLHRTIGIYQPVTEAEKTTAFVMLEKENLAHLADQPFAVLSAGEKRRVVFLRAMARKPRLLLLDEPFESLDISNREHLAATLSAQDLRETAFILITHRIEEILPLFTHILLLNQGKILCQGTINHCLTDKNLSEMFGLPITMERRGRRMYSIIT